MSFDLKATAHARGLRQKAVAETLAVSEATISLWAAALRDGDHRRVPAERARQLADVLGVPPGSIRPDLWPVAA